MVKWISNLTLLTASSLLLGCTSTFIQPNCPYIEPLDINVTTNAKGGLDAKNTAIALNSLKYYGTEARRLKALVVKRNK